MFWSSSLRSSARGKSFLFIFDVLFGLVEVLDLTAWELGVSCSNESIPQFLQFLKNDKEFAIAFILIATLNLLIFLLIYEIYLVIERQAAK